MKRVVLSSAKCRIFFCQEHVLAVFVTRNNKTLPNQIWPRNENIDTFYLVFASAGFRLSIV